MALDCWTKIIIEPLKDRLVKLLLEQIHLFVKIIFKFLICLFVFFLIKLYDKSFESPLLQATGEYYREEGNRCLAKLDCIQYMKKVREKEKYCVCEQKLNIFVLRFYYFSMTKNFVVENF